MKYFLSTIHYSLSLSLSSLTHVNTLILSRDHKVIHCRIHTKTDEGAAHIKYFTEREVMFESIYELVLYYQVF